MIFKISGKHWRFATEALDEFDTRAEAEKMPSEYRLAFGSAWNIYIEESRE
jgi:hypothetical protein